MRTVEIASGEANVVLPNGGLYDAGDQVVLTDEDFAKLNANILGTVLLDLGETGGVVEAAGAGLVYIKRPLRLADLANGDVDEFTPGFAGHVVSVRYINSAVGAGASATAALNLEIDGVNVTGGVVTVALASTDTIGEVSNGTAVTAANLFDADSVIQVEAASVTVYTAGAGTLEILCQRD